MPLELRHIREQLLPGLLQYRVIGSDHLGNSVIEFINVPAPEPVSLPVAVAMGVAAAVVSNPDTTRRSLFFGSSD